MRLRNLLLLFVATGWVAAGSAEEMTYRQAATLLLDHNPALAQKRLQTEAASAGRDRARSAYFPRLDFTQSLNYSNNPVYVFGSLLNQRQFSEANFNIDSLNDPDALADHSSKFELSWLLYDFGDREGNARASDAEYRITLLTEDATRSSLLLELVRRYYAVSIAQQRLITAAENLKSAEARWEQARNRFDQGLAVKTEQLSAEVFHSRRKQEQLDAENNLKLARVSLRDLLGFQNEIDLQTSELSEREFPERKLEEWKELMKQHRPELMMAREGTKLASGQVSSSRAAFLPALQAWSAYEWHGESLDYTGQNWGAGVALRWNLFRGGSDSKQYSQARLLEKASRERLRETENALQVQLESAYYRYQNAKEKVHVASGSRDEAEENLRIHADRYGAGLVTIQDALQAEAARGESELFYLQNLYELYVAHAELLISAGLAEELLTGE